MNRVLAAQHGSAYVQLAVFAIDVDRVYVEHSADPRLAFAWEVFVTECYVLGRVAPDDQGALGMLEDACIAVLEQPPDEQGFGSQLLFAVYDAVERGFYAQALAAVFARWRKRPRQLRKALDALWRAPAAELAACARACLAQPLEPPLAPPTRQALEAMVAGHWPLPR